MEKDQEQKPICKVCGKSFPSGMSLGGHMRSHFVKKSSKKPKVPNSKLAFVVDDDDDNDDGHVLSEFKKKSLNVSNEENNTAVYENETKCKECGKEFPSVRSLCGHMRWHTVKTREEDHVCRQCGKEFNSMRALFGHMTHHSRKSKVSNESAYSQSDSEDNVTGNFYSSSLYSSSYDVDSVEIKEAAVILMMLSRGMTQRGLSNFVLKESEGTGLICKLDILDKKKNKMNRRNKLATRGSCTSFMYEKEEAEFDDLDSLSSRGDGKKVRMEASDDRFDQDDDFGNEFSGLEINGKRKRVEPGKNFKVEKVQRKENSAEVKGKGLNKSKPHVCRICSKSFQTRKGLGGHKKAHKNEVFENKSQGSISMEQEVDDTDNAFGLKSRVDTEKEAHVDLGLKPWMLKGDRKHEPLLITASAN